MVKLPDRKSKVLFSEAAGSSLDFHNQHNFIRMTIDSSSQIETFNALGFYLSNRLFDISKRHLIKYLAYITIFYKKRLLNLDVTILKLKKK